VTHWEVAVASPTGLFAGGKAAAAVTANSYDPETGEIAVSQDDRTITLRGSN
jgi:hypothetical protein